MNERLRGYLGLAHRGRMALIGKAIIETWNKRKVYVLVLANDAQSTTQEKLVLRAKEINVPILYAGSKAELGQALGLREVSSIAISDKGLATQIIAVIKEES
jgi:ribosomal protein L7Ae-like RNA K-turn-binding protein